MKTINIRTLYLFLFLSLIISCNEEQKESPANVVNVRLYGEPDQLNPLFTFKDFYKQVEWKIFMPLLQFEESTMDLYPVLADSRPKVEIIKEGDLKDGRKYIFEIRKEAKWDDGKEVSAVDFLFTLKCALHPEIGHSGFREFLSFIKSVESDPANPKRFSVFTKPSFNLAEVVIGTMAIYPQHLYDHNGVLEKIEMSNFINQKLITEQVKKDSTLIKFAKEFRASGFSNSKDQIRGCGPYEVEEWTSGERIILKKKKEWWAENINNEHHSFGNYPEQLIYHFVESSSTLTSLLKEQKIDVAAQINPPVYEELKANKLIQQHFNFFNPTSPSYSFISFNTKTPKLADKRTRKALAHLLDIDALIKVAMNGYANRTNGPILPVKPYYNNDLEAIDFNLDLAKELLGEAGWKDENQDGILEKSINGAFVDFNLKYKYTNNNAVAESAGLLLKSNALKAGIQIDLVPLDFGKLIADTRRRDFDLYCSRWSQMPGLDDLRNIWHTSNDTPIGFNKSGFGNARSDALIDSINVEMNTNIRNAMYQEIQKIIYDEQPYIFLFVPQERVVIHKRFKAKGSIFRPGFFENTFQLIE